MDKININNLYPCKNTLSKFGTLDINSLRRNNRDESKVINSDKIINSIVQRRDMVRKKIIETYENLLKICVNKIMERIRISLLDLIYEIPKIILELCEYNPKDCLSYIEEKLRTDGFDVYKINDTCIFITWKYLELNIKNNN